MGTPCEINSILKLKPAQGYPELLAEGRRYSAQKQGYRIMPMDAPIALVDENWFACADIKIHKLVWERSMTYVEFEIVRVYPVPFLTKG
ncbi:MAG: DUF2584 family protein [Microcoleaceae cyanobacterium]